MSRMLFETCRETRLGKPKLRHTPHFANIFSRPRRAIGGCCRVSKRRSQAQFHTDHSKTRPFKTRPFMHCRLHLSQDHQRNINGTKRVLHEKSLLFKARDLPTFIVPIHSTPPSSLHQLQQHEQALAAASQHGCISRIGPTFRAIVKSRKEAALPRPHHSVDLQDRPKLAQPAAELRQHRGQETVPRCHQENVWIPSSKVNHCSL